jgi:rhamnosyltransferase
VISRNQQASPGHVDPESVSRPLGGVKTKAARSVCAVMVCYHPKSETIENIRVVLNQVQALVIVDNGSDANEISTLRASSQASGSHLIENRENRGIAEALNQGIAWAGSQGYSWVILFDQDSTITSGFIDQMFATWEAHPKRERIGSIHPRYRDRLTGVEARLRGTKYEGGPLTSMTSGTLMPMWIFDRVGYFASDFFIDCVDHEYCFRLLATGYYVVDSKEAVLLHSPGQPVKVNVLGFSFSPTHHSAVRRYYMSRNRVVVCRKYIHRLPTLVLQYVYVTLRETAKCFLGERDRARKFRNFLLGTWDGLVGRMGKREDL